MENCRNVPMANIHCGTYESSNHQYAVSYQNQVNYGYLDRSYGNHPVNNSGNNGNLLLHYNQNEKPQDGNHFDRAYSTLYNESEMDQNSITFKSEVSLLSSKTAIRREKE